MAISEEDRKYYEGVLYEHERRLKIRIWQLARHGDDADPAIKMEADDLRIKIAAYKAILEPPLPDDVADLARRRMEDDYLFLFQQLLKSNERTTVVEGQIVEIKEDVKKIAQTQHAASLERLDTAARIERIEDVQRTESSKRGRFQPLTVAMWVVIVVILLVIGLFGRVYL